MSAAQRWIKLQPTIWEFESLSRDRCLTPQVLKTLNGASVPAKEGIYAEKVGHFR
jgi:hypothetical protein